MLVYLCFKFTVQKKKNNFIPEKANSYYGNALQMCCLLFYSVWQCLFFKMVHAFQNYEEQIDQKTKLQYGRKNSICLLLS